MQFSPQHVRESAMGIYENDEADLNLEPVVSNTVGRQSTIHEGGAVASVAFPLSQTSPRAINDGTYDTGLDVRPDRHNSLLLISSRLEVPPLLDVTSINDEDLR